MARKATTDPRGEAAPVPAVLATCGEPCTQWDCEGTCSLPVKHTKNIRAKGTVGRGGHKCGACTRIW